MNRIKLWMGCTVLAMGAIALPAFADDQPDLSGPPAQRDSGPRAGGDRGGPPADGEGRRFNGERDRRPGDRIAEILKQLNLTDDQKAKVRELLKSDATDMAAQRQQVQAAMQQLHKAVESKDQDQIKAAREKLKQLHEANRDKLVSQLNTVLTDEQKTKLHELMKQREGDRPGARGGEDGRGGPEGRRGGPLEKLQADLTKLKLTDDQKSQIESIIKTHREAMEKYMAEHKDQMEQIRQKVQDAMQSKDRDAAKAAREEMRKLMEASPAKPRELMQDLGKVLTDEQRQQLKQMMQQQRRGDGPREGGDEMGGRQRGPRDRGPGGPNREGNGPPPPPADADQLNL